MSMDSTNISKNKKMYCMVYNGLILFYKKGFCHMGFLVTETNTINDRYDCHQNKQPNTQCINAQFTLLH